MSLLADRQALATALSTVTGVTGYADPDQQLTNTGDATARWTGQEAQPNTPALVFLVNWEILVVAGRTPSEGLAWLDANLSTILDALDALVWITGVSPSVIQTPNGDLFGVVIEAKKES